MALAEIGNEMIVIYKTLSNVTLASNAHKVTY